METVSASDRIIDFKEACREDFFVLNHILITDKNKQEFRSVLPAGLGVSYKRLILGCYDDGGEVLGAMSLVLSSYVYEMDWL